MTRAALYMRVSTVDQHPETQLLDLRQMAAQRGLDIVREYTDRISGVKAKRPGLDAMMTDARRGQFDVVLVWASDRIARSVKHFLDVLDELNRLKIEFVSFRESIDTAGPLGRAIVVIIGAVAELELAPGARGPAPPTARGSAHRPQSVGTGQRRHPTRPLPGPEYPRNRQRTSHLDGHCATSASKASTPSTSTGSTRKIGLNLAITNL
jgi:hypothetical protein